MPPQKIEEKDNKEENVKDTKYGQNSNPEELKLLSNNIINIKKKLINKKTQTNDTEEKDVKKKKACTFCGY